MLFRSRLPWRYRIADYAMKAYRGVRYIKGLVNSEKHHHDVALGSSDPTTSGSSHNITAIAVGDTISTRTGNSILMKSIAWRYCLEINASATRTQVRILIVKDLQQGADTNPTMAQVLENVAVDSLLNIASLGRFTILKDETILLDNVNRSQVFRKGYYPMSHHVRYNGTASTDIQKGGIYVMYMSNEATNFPTLDAEYRVSFYDN